ncbi:MAG: hypothetical protein K8T20_11305 [Planctomycetes bacterium]|nr:hypothetical protein [Planctomycetota bacterium]
MKFALSALLLPLLCLAASAQVAPYSENFDSGVPTGWVLDPPSTEGVGWNVDATPGLIGGVTSSTYPPGAPSAGSLNFNDGVNFEDITDGAVKGYATSPVIGIVPLAGSVQISFAAAFQTESLGFLFGVDLMYVFILDDTAATVATFSIGDPGSGADIEFAMNTWTTISIDASASLAGSTSCQVQFVFASGDGIGNAFSGFFIDNLAVSCVDSIPPPAPVHVSPADGSTVAFPLVLDWTDSSDTSPCGVGVIAGYQVDVDDDPLFGSINFTTFSVLSTASVAVLPAGTYYWRTFAVDTGVNFSPASVVTTFIVEPALPPLPPDTLFVNEGANGAQSGRAGFVDPVLDESPHFSAIYRDSNTVDNAIAYHFQVTTDPTFLTLDFDSGSMGLSPILPKDSRCLDLTMGINLLRDTVYFWRIQYTDANGATGPFSVAQSFRIGDDFQFGVRTGSTHHGRKKCYIATAAWGGVTPEVGSLMAFRTSVLESSAAGRVFSGWYRTAGAALASGFEASPSSRSATRAILTPIAAGVTRPIALGLSCLVALFGLGVAALRRM